jgi:hypothetical protein
MSSDKRAALIALLIGSAVLAAIVLLSWKYSR